MASEILAVPEEHLEHVISVIIHGLAETTVPKKVEKALRKWCKDEREYIRRCRDGK